LVSRVYAETDRSPQVLRQFAVGLQSWAVGRHGLRFDPPVDQGIEHSAAASFAPNPKYFDPKNIVELAIEGGLQRGRQHVRRLGVGCLGATHIASRSS